MQNDIDSNRNYFFNKLHVLNVEWFKVKISNEYYKVLYNSSVGERGKRRDGMRELGKIYEIGGTGAGYCRRSRIYTRNKEDYLQKG